MTSVLSNERTPGDDQRLIAATLKGDDVAFGKLVRRYQDRLFNAAFRYLDNAEDAQDVVQEAFVSAYVALDSFQGGSQFFTWLYRIAINHAIDLRRKRKNILRLDLQFDDDTQPVDPSVEAQPGVMLEQQEEIQQLRKALQLLSAEHRNVLILKDLDGMKYEEMAEALGVPIGTIRSRLHRARLELREVLEKLETAQGKTS